MENEQRILGTEDLDLYRMELMKDVFTGIRKKIKELQEDTQKMKQEIEALKKKMNESKK